MFFIPVNYTAGKKTETIIMSVELLVGKKFLADKNFALDYSYSRLRRILGKPVDAISFPMGMTPWKVNTVLSLDGFRVCITASLNKGKTLSTQNITQFSENVHWEYYLKKMEEFVRKTSKNPNYVYSEEYDKVSTKENEKLYDIYIQKLEHSIFSKRDRTSLSLLEKSRTKFLKLNIVSQTKVLLNIHQLFGRLSNGCDLSAIGAGKAVGSTTLSTTVSNWKKYYSDVRIIDQSASGLWEKKSENILDLL